MITKNASLHPRVLALKLKSRPVNSPSYVDPDGVLHLVDKDGNPVDFRVKVLDEKTRTVEGYLSVFRVKDISGEMTIPGTFSKSIKERGPKSSAKAKIAFLWMHDMCEPIGQFIELKEDDYGLYFKAVIDNIPQGLRALEQIKSGTLNQFSFGYKYVWDKTKYDDKTDTIVLMEVQLWEGSVVTFGNNMETYAIKSLEELTSAKEELETETEEFINTLPSGLKNTFRQLMTKQASLTSLEPLYVDMQNNIKTLKPTVRDVEPKAGIKWGSKVVSFNKDKKEANLDLKLKLNKTLNEDEKKKSNWKSAFASV
jgi:HK97 family phage prohead protease